VGTTVPTATPAPATTITSVLQDIWDDAGEKIAVAALASTGPFGAAIAYVLNMPVIGPTLTSWLNSLVNSLIAAGVIAAYATWVALGGAAMLVVAALMLLIDRDQQLADKVIDEVMNDVDQIVQLLVDRSQTTDFGVYPADYTDLHFLALKALLPRIIANQEAMLVELDEAVHTCVDDPEALSLLNGVLAGERQITATLKTIKL